MGYRRRTSPEARRLVGRADAGETVPWTIELAASVMCQRWKPAILWLLHRRGRGFAQLSRSLRRISDKVLTHQLQQLERDGLVQKEGATGSRSRHYSLTAIGGQLAECLDQLDSWGVRYAISDPNALRRHGLASLMLTPAGSQIATSDDSSTSGLLEGRAD